MNAFALESDEALLLLEFEKSHSIIQVAKVFNRDPSVISRSLKKLADNYTDFFDDIVHMFNGKKVDKRFESDVSVVLYPLPLVPIMICYWKPDDGLGSSLNLFFDNNNVDSSDDNNDVFLLLPAILTSSFSN